MSLVAVLMGLQGIIALALIVSCKYEDGLIGRIALAGIVLAGVVVVISEVHGNMIYRVSPQILLLLASQALFMARHLYRFVRYVTDGKFGWRKNGEQSEQTMGRAK